MPSCILNENLGIGIDAGFKEPPLPRVIPYIQQPRLNQLCHPYQPFIRLSHSSRPFSCMEITQKFSSYVPTPAGWPPGGTLFAFGGPCLSGASWAALHRVGVPPLPESQPGRQWFWSLLPKQKGLVARGRNPGRPQQGKEAPRKRMIQGPKPVMDTC